MREACVCAWEVRAILNTYARTQPQQQKAQGQRHVLCVWPQEKHEKVGVPILQACRDRNVHPHASRTGSLGFLGLVLGLVLVLVFLGGS